MQLSHLATEYQPDNHEKLLIKQTASRELCILRYLGIVNWKAYCHLSTILRRGYRVSLATIAWSIRGYLLKVSAC